MAYIIVVGNEKGGAGKSTVSMHIAIALSRLGFSVAAVDLDLRQKSFGRYIENRHIYLQKIGISLPTPVYRDLPDIDPEHLPLDANPYDIRLSTEIAKLDPEFDYIIIDCPGSHTRLSKMAHSMADTLITPLNDSFVDFDLLAKVDPENHRIIKPSIYSEMVWSARQIRAEAGLKATDWIVLRNRIGNQYMHNKRKVGGALKELSKRIGFRIASGFSERVIFREFFPRGITLLDLKDTNTNKLSISNIAARQELRDLIRELNLPGVKPDF